MSAYKFLEHEFNKFVGSDYSVSVNSGTSALTLAVRALKIGKGDTVIIPTFTMVATQWAVEYNGAKVVFVDCGSDLNINVDLIEKEIRRNTKAIICTHIYGRSCNMSKLLEICRKRNLRLIEDACEVHGGEYLGKKLGTFGDIGCFSFYENKIVNAEEGGMCVTDNKYLSNRMNWLKNMTFASGAYKYRHVERGFNFRMPQSQAMLALSSLKKVKKNLKKRRKIESWYNKFLIKEVQKPNRNAVWVYDINTEYRDEILKQITDARPYFYPLRGGEWALKFWEKGVYLPVFPKMRKKHVKKISKIINKIYEVQRHSKIRRKSKRIKSKKVSGRN